MSFEAIEVDAMLLAWTGETHKNGPRLTLELIDEKQIEPFKMKTLKKGKTAGQMFKVVFVEVDGNGEPLPPEAAPTPPAKRSAGGFPGGLCGLAVRWCQEPEFAEWLADTFPAAARECPVFDAGHEAFASWIVKTVCQIESRKVLSQPGRGAAIFENEIRPGYAAHRREIGLE